MDIPFGERECVYYEKCYRQAGLGVRCQTPYGHPIWRERERERERESVYYEKCYRQAGLG